MENHRSGQARQLVIQLGAALIVVVLIIAVNLVLLAPPLRNRAEYLFVRLQSEIKKLRPHAQYVPTPAPTATTNASSGAAPATPTPTYALAFTHTPTATPQVVRQTATPLPTPTMLPSSVQIENECHEPQGWNNCGPATLAMALRFYGWTGDQYAVAGDTKPDKNDKNVSPDEMVAYARAQEGIEARMGVAESTDVLKLLLSNGFPVVVETWFIPEPGDEMGHYRLLTGYDDKAQVYIAQDAYAGAHQELPYDELGAMWKVFNRVYVIVFPEARAGDLDRLLGDRTGPQMFARALQVALDEIATSPDDRYAWFNAGSNYVGLGQYEEAAAAYDRARTLNLPWRMLWYQFGPFDAYLQVGRYPDVIALADANLTVTPNLEESYYYRALARRALGDQTGAAADLEAALRYNPRFEAAREAQRE